MWGTSRAQPLTHEQQVQSIKNENRFCQDYGAGEYALGLRLKSTGLTCTVKIRIPPQYPTQRPTVQVVLDGYNLYHPWLDRNHFVRGCAELNNWQPSQPLGPVIAAIMRQFSSTAPTATPVSAAPAPTPQQQHAAPSTSTSATAAAFALGTFELVSKEQGQPQFRGGLPPGGYPPSGNMGPAGWTPPASTGMQQPHAQQQWQQQQPPAQQQWQQQQQQQQPPAQRSTAHTQLPPVPAYFVELDEKRLAELQVMDVDESTRRAFLEQQESLKTLQELNTGLKQDNLTACLQHLDAEQVISAMQRDITALQRTAEGTEEAVRALEARRSAVHAAGGAASLAQKLKAAAAASDRDSEQQFSAFVEGQGVPPAEAGAAQQARWLTSCVAQYIESRTEHHKHLATAELLRAKGFKAPGAAAEAGALV